ncbi:MAG: hypothetical protein ACE5D6_08860 [Candidatus Zixiibacteriota bacterium]
MVNDIGKASKKKQPYWLVYLSLLISGILLIADAYQFAHLYRWTARLGIALIFSALALFVGNGRQAGFIAVIIIWLAVIAAYLI